MKEPYQMTKQEIHAELDSIEKFIDDARNESMILADPAPYERAGDREEALYAELGRRGDTTPYLSRMFRY